MRSSTVNFLRGLIMLSCLISLPAIAIFGLPMPSQVSTILQRLGLFAGDGEDRQIAAAPEDSCEQAGNPFDRGMTEYTEHSPPRPRDRSPNESHFDPMVVQASNEALSAPVESSKEGVGLFRGIQQRLRLLGATYYRLESWGEQGDMFHFQCRVAVDGHANFTRHFEATGEDPLTAMDSVLQEIESWKDRRGPVETSVTTP